MQFPNVMLIAEQLYYVQHLLVGT